MRPLNKDNEHEQINPTCHSLYGTAKYVQWDFINIGQIFGIWPILFVQEPGQTIIIPPDFYHAVIGYDNVNICQAVNYVPRTPKAIDVINRDINLYNNHDEACNCDYFGREKGHNDILIIRLASECPKRLNQIRMALVRHSSKFAICYKCYKQYDQEISSDNVPIDNINGDDDINITNNSNNNHNSNIDSEMIDKSIDKSASKQNQCDQSHGSSPSFCSMT